MRKRLQAELPGPEHILSVLLKKARPMMGRKKNKLKAPPAKFQTQGGWHTHHIVLFDDLLKSPAFIKLSANAKAAYIILLQEYKGQYSGTTVICPYRTFIEKGMSRNSIFRAITQLECYGFIIIDHGGLFHSPSKYTFDDRWKEIKTPDQLQAAERRFRQELALSEKSDKQHQTEPAEINTS